MSAVSVGLLFGVAALVAGVRVATLLSTEAPPFALGATIALALIVLAGTDVAAVWRFEPGVVVGAWALLVAAGLWSADVRVAATRSIRALWPSARAGILAATILLAGIPLFILPVPLDTDAQGFGMLALAIRDGGTIQTLAPWRPDIAYLYAPGALLLFATTSALAKAVAMPAVMMGLSHAYLVVFVGLAWELGREVGDQSLKPAAERGEVPATSPEIWAWAMCLSAALSVGLWTALLDSHYTAVAGLTFALAWCTATCRYARTGNRWDLAAATIAIAAVFVTHADTAMVSAFGLLAFLLSGWQGRSPLEVRRWLAATTLAPLGALALASPWLLGLWPLLRTGIRSPYEVSLSHWRVVLLFQGMIWPALAAVGAVVWIGRRRAWALAMAVWLIAIVESSTVGFVERLVPALTGALLRFNYPYSVAWHGPVIPCMALGSGAIVWLVERGGLRRLPAPGWRIITTLAIVAGIGVTQSQHLLALSRSVLGLHGGFASMNDVRVMRWLQRHTPRAARVLNYPGDYEGRRDWEGHWAPVIAERDAVYFRMQPFFLESPGRGNHGEDGRRGLAGALAEQQSLLSFWRDPADPGQALRLAAAGIDYVLVPEFIGDPASLARAWRWQPPARLQGTRSNPDRAPYLELAYESGGAQVWAVVGSAHAMRYP